MFLLLWDISVLAQASPAVEKVTAGQMLSGLLVLSVMASSLAMIVVWVTRMGQTGHALPAAQRGILRVPVPMTIVAIGLSLLMLLLAAMVSLQDPEASLVGAAPVALTTEERETAKNDSTKSPPPTKVPSEIAETRTSEDKTATAEQKTEIGQSATPSSPGSTAGMTPDDMTSALVQTVIMDVFFFLTFGIVVFVSSSFGRVRLKEMVSRVWQKSQPITENSIWPDLDDTSALPESLQYTRPDQSVSLELPQGLSVAEQEPVSLSRERALIPDVGSDVSVSSEPDEAFSFRTELRYAGEVFLAAYLPTAILRVIVVLLTIGIVGQDPGQHPFLEMMDAGVGVGIIALILLTAVFLAPVVEELQFRVVILGGIAQMGSPMLALSVSSMFFAFAHGFPDSLALMPLAFALGYTYIRRRSYIAVMMVHFLFNGFNMVLALLSML